MTTSAADLPLAPDEHAGFLMTLLRMLAFRPEGTRAGTEPGKAAPTPTPTSKKEFDGDWRALVPQLSLAGGAKELARNAELSGRRNGVFELVVPKAMTHLAADGYRDKLQEQLGKGF